jgi:hypothetical protein
LYGSAKIQSFDFVEQDPELNEGFSWAKMRGPEEQLIGPCTAALFADQGNLHEITAGPELGCAFLDILAPPYDAHGERPCTYYAPMEVPEALMADEGAAQAVGKGHLLLAEFEPDDDFQVLSGRYAGPSVCGLAAEPELGD